MNPEPETVAPPGPDSGLRALAVPLGVLGSVAAAFAYVATVDPNEPGHYPACPLLYHTGVYCPGCGGLRSAHAFAHGDLPAALGANALAVVGFGLFAVGWALWAVRAARGRPVRLELGRAQLWGVGVVVALFTLVRNLPFGGWLHP
ncbi:membrane protein [Streptomyces aureoverticillatus]|nr:membrane protein [Streptomyces aureoverticillatus]